MKSSTELTKRLSLPALLGRLKDVISIDIEFLDLEVPILLDILDVLPDSFYFACKTWNSLNFIEVMKFTKSKMMVETMKIDRKTKEVSSLCVMDYHKDELPSDTPDYSSGFLWQLSIQLKSICRSGGIKGPFENLAQAVQIFTNTI